MIDSLISKLERRFVLTTAEKDALVRVSVDASPTRSRKTFISQGDIPDQIHLIQSGFACRYKIMPNGGRSIIGFLIPGDFCDINTPLLGTMDHSIRTLSLCEIARIPRAVMDDLISSYPVLDRALRWAGLVEEAILREWVISTRQRSADMQVAHLFCEFWMRLQSIGLVSQDGYDLPITQGDLSETTGLSLVHINRVLHKLRADNLLIFKDKYAHIPNITALQAFSGFNAEYLGINSTIQNIR